MLQIEQTFYKSFFTDPYNFIVLAPESREADEWIETDLMHILSELFRSVFEQKVGGVLRKSEAISSSELFQR